MFCTKDVVSNLGWETVREAPIFSSIQSLGLKPYYAIYSQGCANFALHAPFRAWGRL